MQSPHSSSCARRQARPSHLAMLIRTYQHPRQEGLADFEREGLPDGEGIEDGGIAEEAARKMVDRCHIPPGVLLFHSTYS